MLFEGKNNNGDQHDKQQKVFHTSPDCHYEWTVMLAGDK